MSAAESVFTKKCWRCFPAFCRCEPDENEVEQIKSERFLAERAWLEEKTRRQAAEVIIAKIINDHGNGCLSLGEIVQAAEDYAARYGEAHR